MVRKINDLGQVYHEPPYSWEEEQAFYHAAGGATSLTIIYARFRAPRTEPPARLTWKGSLEHRTETQIQEVSAWAEV
jgi:hypothetical protein